MMIEMPNLIPTFEYPTFFCLAWLLEPIRAYLLVTSEADTRTCMVHGWAISVGIPWGKAWVALVHVGPSDWCCDKFGS